MRSDRCSSWEHKQSRQELGDWLMNKREVRSPLHAIHKRKQSQRVIND